MLRLGLRLKIKMFSWARRGRLFALRNPLAMVFSQIISYLKCLGFELITLVVNGWAVYMAMIEC